MSRFVKIVCGLCIGLVTFASVSPAKVSAAELENEKKGVEETREEMAEFPQMIVDSYEIVNGSFERSAECTLRVYIKNIADNEPVKVGSIMMFSSYIYPVFGKTNQMVFGELGPGEMTYVDFEVNLDKIINGPNPIEFNLTWVDQYFVHYYGEVHISPILLEEIGFEITDIKVPNTVYGSKNTTISVAYENVGVENLQNVYMILDGDLAQGLQVVELDDIAAKGKDMVEYSLELLNMDENRISVSFKYEDRNGTEYNTDAIEKTVTVTDKNYISPAPEETDVKELIGEYRVFVVFGIVAVLLCIPFLIGLIARGGKKR